MKGRDRVLKHKGYRQTNIMPGVTTESVTLANGHKIEVKTTTIHTLSLLRDGRDVNRNWSRSVIVPESTMR